MAVFKFLADLIRKMVNAVRRRRRREAAFRTLSRRRSQRPWVTGRKVPTIRVGAKL